MLKLQGSLPAGVNHREHDQYLYRVKLSQDVRLSSKHATYGASRLAKANRLTPPHPNAHAGHQYSIVR